MASAIRTKAPMRAIQSFSTTSVKIPSANVTARNLHMTGAREASPALTNPDALKANVPKENKLSARKRKFNTSRSLKTVNDSSTVDFAYMPEVSFANPASTTIPQTPLLPDNYNPQRATERVAAAAAEPAVRMPEISTTTLGNAVSAFTEAETNEAADTIGLVETKAKEKVGMVKQVVSDMLDDLLGAKRSSTA